METGRIGNKTVSDFVGREYRGRQGLCAGVQGRQRTAGVKGQRPLAGYRAAAPVQSVEVASLYSGVQRWKTSAQGKLMCASTCTGYYLTQNFAGNAAFAAPLPPRKIFEMRRNMPIETDKAQRTLRQKRNL
ncbi:MAG: hypothetical protein UCM69_06570 [Dialister invisus]|nr:hypothetical protein [Dialister invisus]